MKNLCNLCPRNCNVEREQKLGFCGIDNQIHISKVMLHHFEEPIVSGTNGSGAIFFSGCNLRCVYCQNFEISRQVKGKIVSINELAQIFKDLESQGAHNINLVTPTPYTYQILAALDIYHPQIPIIWNTSGYEKPETIERLRDYVDIFLTDFKYYSNDISNAFSKAFDYQKYATQALLKMRELQPLDIIDDGLMKKGIIIRHLVLPNCIPDSCAVLSHLQSILKNPIISLMSQYTPIPNVQKELNRQLKPIEYKIVLKKCMDLGLDNVFIQDLTSASNVYTPIFDNSLE